MTNYPSMTTIEFFDAYRELPRFKQEALEILAGAPKDLKRDVAASSQEIVRETSDAKDFELFERMSSFLADNPQYGVRSLQLALYGTERA